MLHEYLAIGFLWLLIAVPVMRLLLFWRRTAFTPFQYLLWIAAVLLTRVWWRARLPRCWPLGSESGGVVVCNHRSSVDPFFLQACLLRPMHWMVAREYCENPAFGWFLRACEVIPVNRGGIDTAATKAAIRYAEHGEFVGMFPEGRINQSEQFMMPIRPGAALVALHARKPLLPCYIDGSPFQGTPWSPFFMPARVTVTFGELIDVASGPRRDQDESVAHDLMMRTIAELARLAGRTDFQPAFAGRHWKPTPEEIRAQLTVHSRRV